MAFVFDRGMSNKLLLTGIPLDYMGFQWMYLRMHVHRGRGCASCPTISLSHTMRLSTTFLFASIVSVAMGAKVVQVYSGSNFQGQETNLDTDHPDRCVHIGDMAVGSIKMQTCDAQCTAYTDFWCEEEWNSISCQGWGFISLGQLKSVKCN
ncbi:hypothetical protein NQZ79_g8086 [Umbelopsis isabellina]|nr:hypothetical protein NQZ79_g8086 [Umbelopsis isabellina]